MKTKTKNTGWKIIAILFAFIICTTTFAIGDDEPEYGIDVTQSYTIEGYTSGITIEVEEISEPDDYIPFTDLVTVIIRGKYFWDWDDLSIRLYGAQAVNRYRFDNSYHHAVTHRIFYIHYYSGYVSQIWGTQTSSWWGWKPRASYFGLRVSIYNTTTLEKMPVEKIRVAGNLTVDGDYSTFDKTMYDKPFDNIVVYDKLFDNDNIVKDVSVEGNEMVFA